MEIQLVFISSYSCFMFSIFFIRALKMFINFILHSYSSQFINSASSGIWYVVQLGPFFGDTCVPWRSHFFPSEFESTGHSKSLRFHDFQVSWESENLSKYLRMMLLFTMITTYVITLKEMPRSPTLALLFFKDDLSLW